MLANETLPRQIYERCRCWPQTAYGDTGEEVVHVRLAQFVEQTADFGGLQGCKVLGPEARVSS